MLRITNFLPVFVKSQLLFFRLDDTEIEPRHQVSMENQEQANVQTHCHIRESD